MHGWPFVQQSQIAFAPQQRLYPVQQPQPIFFSGAAFLQPKRGSLHQPTEADARLFTKRKYAGVVAPQYEPCAELRGPMP